MSAAMTSVARARIREPGRGSGMSSAACCSSCHPMATGVKARAGIQKRAMSTTTSQRGLRQRRIAGILRTAHSIVLPMA